MLSPRAVGACKKAPGSRPKTARMPTRASGRSTPLASPHRCVASIYSTLEERHVCLTAPCHCPLNSPVFFEFIRSRVWWHACLTTPGIRGN